MPLIIQYSWECVRDCPWKGPNARLLVRYAEHLSKFRVCVHSLSLAKRWAAGGREVAASSHEAAAAGRARGPGVRGEGEVVGVGLQRQDPEGRHGYKR